MRTILAACVPVLVLSATSYVEDRTLPSQEMPNRLCESALSRILVGDIADGFQVLKAHMLFAQDEDQFKAFVGTLSIQIGAVAKQAGEPVGHELVEEKAIRDTFRRYTYLCKYEKRAIRCVFTFYRPKDEWLLHTVWFDENVEALFR